MRGEIESVLKSAAKLVINPERGLKAKMIILGVQLEDLKIGRKDEEAQANRDFVDVAGAKRPLIFGARNGTFSCGKQEKENASLQSYLP